jgi:two-component system cell cycle response regulator DivK
MREGHEVDRPDRQGAVLIVEDNLDNLSIYTTILEFHGFAVAAAEDGVRALEMARTSRPDLILMDISIPGVDGWEVTRTLKDDPATAQIPILVLTAHALSSDRDRAYMEGADGYIAKPAEPSSVVTEIRRMLRKTSLETAT